MRPIASLAVAALLLSGSTALAQATPGAASPATSTPVPCPQPVEPKMSRELGGHTFLPSHIVDNPFSESAFGVTFGLGAGEALAPTLQWTPPDPPALGPDKWYGYTALGIGVVGSYRILEYLSIRAGLATNAYIGSGNGAVVAIGSSARITAGLGVKGSLPIGDTVRLAATFDLTYGPVYSVLIAQGMRDTISACIANPQTCTIQPGTFLQQQETVTYVAGLVGSWAPWKFLGFTLNGQFLAPTKTGRASYSQNGLLLAGMADFDAKPLLSWLPLGFNAGYTLTSPVGSNGVTTLQEFGFGLYYTGRRDLALGLEIDWKLGHLESQQVSQVALGWLNFKYYWD